MPVDHQIVQKYWISVFLTMILAVKLFVSGSENLRTNLKYFVLLVAFVWILPSFYIHPGAASNGSVMNPTLSTFMRDHSRLVWAAGEIVIGLAIYFSVTS